MQQYSQMRSKYNLVVVNSCCGVVRRSTNFGNNFKNIWYPVSGFGPTPADQAAENQKANENLELFTSQFLCGPGKFIGGLDSPSIADYVCATKFHCLNNATIKAVVGYELPARVKAYVADFLEACPSRAFLEVHDGFFKSKMIPTKVTVRGMALSHNVIPSVLLAMDTGCGDFEERSSLSNTAPYTISRVD